MHNGDWDLSEVAAICRKGHLSTFKNFHVKRNRHEEFFKAVNGLMRSGEKKISQTELDALALGTISQPQPPESQKRIAGPVQVEKPKSIAIDGCLEIVSKIEAHHAHNKESIAPAACKLMRDKLTDLSEQGATSIEMNKWDRISQAAIDMANAERMLEINRSKLKLLDQRMKQEQEIVAITGRKIAEWKTKNP